MQTINKKLLAELQSSKKKIINGEMVTLIDEDLRCALFDLLCEQPEAAESEDISKEQFLELQEMAASGVVQISDDYEDAKFIIGGATFKNVLDKHKHFLAGCQRKYTEGDMKAAWETGVIASLDFKGFKEWLSQYNKQTK